MSLTILIKIGILSLTQLLYDSFAFAEMKLSVFNPKMPGGGMKEGGGQIDAPPPPCGFSKNIFSKER